MISCIVPTLNRRGMVKEAVRSALCQKDLPCPMEVVVVDDGSTDGTREWMRQEKDRIKGVFSNRLGPGGARNRGAEAASGDLFMFLDSDDLWHEDHASILFDEIRRTGSDAAFCITRNVNSRTGEVFNVPGEDIADNLMPDDMAGLLARWCIILPSSFAIKRESFFSLGGFTDISFGEDWLFFLSLALKGSISPVPVTATTRRLHGESICLNRPDPLRISELLDRIDQELLMAGSRFFPDEFFRKERKSMIFSEASSWYSVQDWYLAMNRHGFI